MRFPHDASFHLRMAALVIGSLFLEQLASKHLQHWSSPNIGIVTFVLGLAWVGLAAFHYTQTLQDRVKVLESRLERLDAITDALADEQRARRSLPKL